MSVISTIEAYTFVTRITENILIAIVSIYIKLNK